MTIKWEYHVVDYVLTFKSGTSDAIGWAVADELQGKSIAEGLASIGSHGWELAAITDCFTNFIRYYFKRIAESAGASGSS